MIEKQQIMKICRLFFISIVLFVSFQICLGQEKPKAFQIDSIEKTNCEDLGARLDSLRTALGDYKDSTGYIIIYGDKANYFGNYKFEELVKNRFFFLGIDTNRIIFIHGKRGQGINTQVWVVPIGAEKPPYIEEKWDYSLPEIKAPFKLHEKVWENEDCGPIQNEKFYSELLLGTSSFQGNIVIYENSSRKFLKTRNNLIAELVNKYKVPLNRLKFYYVKSSGYPNYEFWLVPRKKK